MLVRFVFSCFSASGDNTVSIVEIFVRIGSESLFGPCQELYLSVFVLLNYLVICCCCKALLCFFSLLFVFSSFL